MASGGSGADRLTVQGIELEVLRRGAGRTALLLHGFDTVDAEAPFLDLLGHHIEVIAPSSPGFGHSPRPRDFDMEARPEFLAATHRIRKLIFGGRVVRAS